MKRFPVYVLSILGPWFFAGAEELSLSADEMPRIPATEPASALSTFEIEPGLDLLLAAHEPMVMDPIAMAFDEKGRAYVLEMRGYSERREEALGRVRLLVDKDGDGRFDESTVFKDGLKWPTGIACYEGGVFVGATPDLFYFRDNDGDGVSDEEKHLFTGFGIGKPELNMQALFNSFRWGPDNRIWGATAANGGNVTRVGDSKFGPVSLRGADFSFDPEKLDLRPENGTAQYGLSFDSEGRRFVCSNSRHLIEVAYERHQVLPNPFFTLPGALVDIPVDGAAAPVYRISLDEPWRIVRTRWRVAGVVKGIVEGGGRVSGYFTSASGVHLYWGALFNPEFRNNAFIGDVGSNLVHRKEVRPVEGGWARIGLRPESSPESEFLRSTDNWFRPTSFATGPHGCLFVTDMYRETIEHPWSLPAPIKDHLDLNSGFERGRIYRISPEGFKGSAVEDLSLLSTMKLQEILKESPTSQWRETTARRLLYERGKPASKPTPAPFPASLTSKEAPLTQDKAAAGNQWMKAAYLNSLRTPGEMLAAWQEADASRSPLGPDIASMAGRSRLPSLANRVIADLALREPSPWVASCLEGLFRGLKSGPFLEVPAPSDLTTSFSEVKQSPNLQTLKEKSRRALQGGAENEMASISILALLGDTSFLTKELVAGELDSPAQEAIVGVIKDPETVASLYRDLSPNARALSVDALLSSLTASSSILTQIQQEKLSIDVVPAALLDGLRQHSHSDLALLAESILPPVVSRVDVIADYQTALDEPGDSSIGRGLFAKACQTCHQSPDGDGINLGPPTESFATAGRASLLERILDPNREVAPQYEAYVFTLEDDTVFTGIIREETIHEVALLLPGGQEQRFPRGSVKSMQAVGLSLMPEGLEHTISRDEMAHLLAYLESGIEKQ